MKEEILEVQRHYDEDPKKEWDRLQKRHPYEKYITTRVMDRYVQPGAAILDIGGGPGHYSIYYAKKSCRVTLVDLSGENVRFAKKKARQYGVKLDARQGNALDLAVFPDNSFDAVFLMGPLYHLLEEANRIQAIREARRVLKPGGFLFCSFILMFGGVIYGLREVPDSIFWPGEQAWFAAASRDESVAFKGFTYNYETTVKDAEALLGKVDGLRLITKFSQEGILAPYMHNLEGRPRKEQLAWYEYAYQFCEKEAYLTHGEHLMCVAQKQ